MSQVLRKETRPDLMSKEIRPDLISLVGARQTRTSLFFQAETALTRRKIEWSVCRVLLIAGPIRVAFPRRPAFRQVAQTSRKTLRYSLWLVRGFRKSMFQLCLECRHRLRGFGKQLFVLGQQVLYVCGTVINLVWVLEVQTVIDCFDLFKRDTPSTRALGPIVPPDLFGLELFDADWFTFVVALCSGRIRMLVVPDLVCRMSLREKEEVSTDTGIRIEHSIRKANDCVQVAFSEQCFLNASLDTLSEERAIRQNKPSSPSRLQQLHKEHQEQVGCLTRAKLSWKIRFDSILLHATEGRVGDDNIDPFAGRPIPKRTSQSVVMSNIAGNIDSMKEKICDA